MKIRITCLLLVASAVLSTGAIAQTATVTAKIPFEFRLGDKEMPSGTYMIRRIHDNAMAFQREGSRTPVVVLSSATERAGGEAGGSLVFRHIGDQYFLAQVWKSHSGSGREIPASKLQQELARNGAPVKRTVVLASR